jgi:hypothetical protein
MDNEYDLTETRRELLIRVAPYKSREELHQLEQIAYCNVLGVLYSRLNFIALQKSIHYS